MILCTLFRVRDRCTILHPQIVGATKLLLNNSTHVSENSDTAQVDTRSALSTMVLELASIYQAKASDRHLSIGPSKNLNTKMMGLHQFKNLEKAKTIQAEKSKKLEAELLYSGIQVVAMVWVTDKNKLKQVRY